MVVRISTKDVKPVEREPLFYIDEEEFTVPIEVPANVTMAFIRDIRDHGEIVAVAKAFDLLLGEDGLNRLANCPALESDQLKEIMGVVGDKMMSAQKVVLGN